MKYPNDPIVLVSERIKVANMYLSVVYFKIRNADYFYWQKEKEGGDIVANRLFRADGKSIPDAIKYDTLDILQAVLYAEFN